MNLPVTFAVATVPILPVLVFLAETCVVTLCTVRTICVARGRKILAASLGFFEVSIWLFAIGQIMQHLSSPDCYLAFATGFSLGNFLGILIEKKLALGDSVVHITTSRDTRALVESLNAAEYGVTALAARGVTGPVDVVYTVVRRRELQRVLAIIRDFDPKAFYSVNDLQSVAAGVFPAAQERTPRAIPKLVRRLLPTAGIERKAPNRSPTQFAARSGVQAIATAAAAD